MQEHFARPVAMLSVVCLICLLTHHTFAQESEPKDMPGESLRRSIQLIKSSASTYTEERKCFSCHHQTLPLLMMRHAVQTGQTAEVPEWFEEQASFIDTYYTERIDRIKQGQGVPGGSYSAGYALMGLHAAGFKQNSTTQALVDYLLKKQTKSGYWPMRSKRPPLEFSRFTSTAVAMRGLKLYGKDVKGTSAAVEKATTWLETAKPKHTEEWALFVWSWHWLDRPEEVRRAAQELLKLQADDGGWAATSELKSDAYSTGQALAVLLQTKALDREHDKIGAGLQWLRQEQHEDGSWWVKSRSNPFQDYFESGYPHTTDQFISIAAACWASMVLMDAESKQAAPSSTR